MKKLMMLSLLATLLLTETLRCDETLIKITPTISKVTTQDSGRTITISRVQDIGNRLTDDFTKTSRACPPFCIQPMKIDKKIHNIAELELLALIGQKDATKKVLLVDTRLHSWFELETIPSAVNIPFMALESADKKKIEKIFKILGMKVKSNGSWDFSSAKKLIVFDNGIWCSQVNHFVPTLLKHGYPANKILYYRAGLQGWKILGLTTVIHKEIVKK